MKTTNKIDELDRRAASAALQRLPGTARLAGWLAIAALAACGSSTDVPPPVARVTRVAPRPTPHAAPARDAQEAELVATIARDLELSDGERDQVAGSHATFAAARAALFADLDARRVDAEQVSQRLHALRTELAVALNTALGPDRAHAIQLRLRDAHR